MLNKPRFNDIIKTVRDNQDIYPKRGVSYEETITLICYEIFNSYKNIIDTFEKNPIRYNSLKY